MQRVGSQSGWIHGHIALGDVRATSNGKTYIGQIEVTWAREVMSGDSGSPVFIIKRGSEPNHVVLVGILWGSGTIRAMNGDVSPIQNIELTDELGPTLLVCIPGWEC